MSRKLKVISAVLLLLAVLLITIFVRGDQYLFKAVWACYLHGNSGPTISDAKYFDTHPVEAPHQTWEWPLHSGYNQQSLSPALRTALSENHSVAFLVVQNDSILQEHYWDDYSDSSLSNSFSMAKSITTMLAQIAVQKGVFQSWHQKVKTIIPEITGPYAGDLELWHLSTMTAGLDWDESYSNPWSVSARAYYGADAKKLILSLPIVTPPGTVFNYQSGSTELLAICLIRATGKPLATLASEWLWQPLQARRVATWHTDEQGAELAYCCFNSNARDFARFGRLMMHDGNWNGTQILDSSFVTMATHPALSPHYGYSFWLDDSQGSRVFFQWGLLGQYIITVPEYHLVIVRLGCQDVTDKEGLSQYCRTIVGEALKSLSIRKDS